MRELPYTDDMGRKWLMKLPDEAPDSDVGMGIPLGPPPLESLRLPFEIEVRLHNELFHRGIFTERDVRGRRQDVESALKAALRVDGGRIAALYAEGGILAAGEDVEDT